MTEKRGVLSLWVFREIREDLDDSILEEEYGVDDYNEELLELGGSDDWEETPLRDVLSEMSLFESWSDQAVEKASKLGITKCRKAFIILNYNYNPKVVTKLPDDPVFIGSFKFNY